VIDEPSARIGRLRLGEDGSASSADAIADELRWLTGRGVDVVRVGSVNDLGGDAWAGSGALRAGLLAGEIDCAVYALKDVPIAPDSRLKIVAIPAREDPRDVLIGTAPLGALHPGAHVGTGSARRLVMLRELRPDLQYIPVPGDVDACLEMLAGGELAAAVLPMAGLNRGGRSINIVQVFNVEQLLPEPGQGALALECLAERHDVIQSVCVLHDPRTANAVTAERAFQAAMDIDRQMVIGTYSADDGHVVSLMAAVMSPDGKHAVRVFGTRASIDGVALGRALAVDLLAAAGRWPAGDRDDRAPGHER
jgi:hydroxymethylbilane synthase